MLLISKVTFPLNGNATSPVSDTKYAQTFYSEKLFLSAKGIKGTDQEKYNFEITSIICNITCDQSQLLKNNTGVGRFFRKTTWSVKKHYKKVGNEILSV